MQRANARIIIWVAALAVVSTWARIGQPSTYDVVPKRIGVINALHDIDGPGQGNAALDYETNDQAVEDIASLGMQTVKIWPRVSYESAEMAAVFTNPDIDVIVLRPIENSVWESSPCDPELNAFVDENIDYGVVASYLYSQFGNEQKVIILTNWESDHQLKGFACPDNVPSEPEILTYLVKLDQAQAGVAQARTQNIGKNLRVYNAVEVAHTMGIRPFEVVRDVICRMAQPPDFISYSRWSHAHSIADQLDYIETHTGLPRTKIFIGEHGRDEGYNTNWQYPYIHDNLDEAFSWGVGALPTSLRHGDTVELL